MEQRCNSNCWQTLLYVRIEKPKNTIGMWHGPWLHCTHQYLLVQFMRMLLLVSIWLSFHQVNTWIERSCSFRNTQFIFVYARDSWCRRFTEHSLWKRCDFVSTNVAPLPGALGLILKSSFTGFACNRLIEIMNRWMKGYYRRLKKVFSPPRQCFIWM